MNTISIVKRELLIDSLYEGYKISVDLTYDEGANKLFPIIFTHNFKSFKDWGAFNLVAEQAASEGFLFIKYNCSHDGITPEYPTEFTDLAAFKKNNLSIELDDLRVLINHLFEGNFQVSNIDLNLLSLIGHGRGGDVSLIKASEDDRVRKVASWNAFDRILDFSPEVLQQWKEDGVKEFWNVRLKKHMPVGYQFVEDYYANEERFDMEKAMSRLTKPSLLIHGNEDTRIRPEGGQNLLKYSTNAELLIIEKADHNFGVYHPYMLDYLNSETRQACTASLKFFKR